MEHHEKQIFEEYRADFVDKMKADTVIHHLRNKGVLSSAFEEEVHNISHKREKVGRLIDHLIDAPVSYIQQFKIALIKSGHTGLAKHFQVHKTSNDENMCILHLGGDIFVVAKDFQRKEILIHIRHYEEKGGNRYPTKQEVTLNLSRWLTFEQKLAEIDMVYQEVLSGHLDEDDEILIHLGGGVYVTVGVTFPTVDIRHFWKPTDSNTPVATKKGVSLNIQKWEKLKNVADVIRDFVPALNSAVICEFTHHAQMDFFECKECSPFEDAEEISPNQEGNSEIMKYVWDHSEKDGP